MNRGGGLSVDAAANGVDHEDGDRWTRRDLTSDQGQTATSSIMVAESALTAIVVVG